MPNSDVQFGVTAVKLGFISPSQLAEAERISTCQPNRSLPKILQDLGWIPADRAGLVQRLLTNANNQGRVHAEPAPLFPFGEAVGPDRHLPTATLNEVNLPDSVGNTSDDDDFQYDSDSESTAEVAPVVSPTIPFDSRYRLKRLHAEGGLSRVWIADDSNLRRSVALKQIRSELNSNPKAYRRFRNEAQITGQLEHPHIVPVYEYCAADGSSANYYTMRLVKGKTLRQACDELHASRSAGIRKPLEMSRLLQAYVSVCQAIAYAHSRGVIHRDIKPENIILGKFGEVVVLDWGLCKTVGRAADDDDSLDDTSKIDCGSQVTSAEQTAAGVVLGTPAYMAPEQARSDMGPIDERTDIFGLGSTLFVILTGSPPHPGKTIKAALKTAAVRPVRRAREINRFVPSALDAICAKATAFRPCDRYVDASEIALDVQRYLADEPISFCGDSLRTKIRRWFRDNRLAYQWIAMVLPLITVALLVWCLILQSRLSEIESNGSGTEPTKLPADESPIPTALSLD